VRWTGLCKGIQVCGSKVVFTNADEQVYLGGEYPIARTWVVEVVAIPIVFGMWRSCDS
jgi:hypothetical protein